MKTSNEGFQQRCSVQVVFDGANRLIVATGPAASANRQCAITVLPDEVETFGAPPEPVRADAGCCSEQYLAVLKACGIDGYGKEREGRRTASRPTGTNTADPIHSMANKAGPVRS